MKGTGQGSGLARDHEGFQQREPSVRPSVREGEARRAEPASGPSQRPCQSPREFSICKNRQIYSTGAHFTRLRGRWGQRPPPPCFALIFPRWVKMARAPPTQIQNQKTEVPKSYSILIPHRKGEGARGREVPGVGAAPQPDRTSPGSCPNQGTPRATALKTPTPHVIKTKEAKKSTLPPQNPNIYIYLYTS